MSTDRSAARPDVILAGASVRSMAESAFRDGLVPCCLDMFSDADLRRRIEHETGCADRLIHQISCLEDVLDHLNRLPADIPLIVCGGLEHSLEADCEVLRSRQVAGPAPSVIQEVSQPEVLFPVLEGHGIPIPQWRAGVNAPGAGQWLRKQAKSSGGTGVHLWSEVKQSDFPKESIPADVYFQEWLEGVAASATFVACPTRETSGDNETPARLIGVSVQLSGVAALNACGFQFCGNAGPVQPTPDLQLQLQRLGEVVAGHWEMNGVFGIDFILHQQTAFPIEVNPRITASHEIHEWAHPESPGHVSLHLSPEKNTHTLRRPAPFLAGRISEQGHQISRLLRFVIYAATDVIVDTAIQNRLFSLEDGSGWRVGDIPCIGSTVRQGTPACSLYTELGTSQAGTSFDPALSPFVANARERLEAVLNQTRDKIRKLESG